MKEYLLNNNEERYLKGIINKTVKRYFTIKYKREYCKIWTYRFIRGKRSWIWYFTSSRTIF